LNNFLKYRLDLIIRYVNLTTGLRVIKGSYFVSLKIFSKQRFKRPMMKVTTSITNKSSRSLIPIEDMLFYKLDHHLWSMVLTRAFIHFDT